MLADLLTGPRKTYQKICNLDELAQHVSARRQLKQKIVLTNGCFDLLHVGHVHYLQQAADEGDCLIVAVNSDASIRRLDKAPDRPLFPQQERAAMLAALDAVDYVLIFDEETPHALLDRLRPDLLVKGGTYRRDEIVGWELVEAYGGDVKPLSVIPGVSTTQIVERLRCQTILKTPAASAALAPERKAG
jgi:D-beta-D-heptose 7-phosphate kinase/D-beta-D-heptose 1-phosphate adenosyltransferase